MATIAKRRDDPVVCAKCERSTARRSRQQRYCSPRCRDRGRVKNPSEGCDTGQSHGPRQNINANNSLQGRKSGSSLPINLLGSGYQWPGARERLDAVTLEKIRRAEVAELSE
jgi:hypothetical protein